MFNKFEKIVKRDDLKILNDQTYEYNAAGRLIRTTCKNGPVTTVNTYYGYNNKGDEIQSVTDDGRITNIEYKYDKYNNRTRRTSSREENGKRLKCCYRRLFTIKSYSSSLS